MVAAGSPSRIGLRPPGNAWFRHGLLVRAGPATAHRDHRAAWWSVAVSVQTMSTREERRQQRSARLLMVPPVHTTCQRIGGFSHCM